MKIGLIIIICVLIVQMLYLTYQYQELARENDSLYVRLGIYPQGYEVDGNDTYAYYRRVIFDGNAMIRIKQEK